VTTNENKFREAALIAKEFGVELEWERRSYTEIQADSLEEIVGFGVEEVCREIGDPCFAEDAGLFIDALNGFPGPYSKFVFLTIGNRGILKLMEGVENRLAEFRSAVAFCSPGGGPVVFSASVRGKITHEPRGTGGFGFDPIFEVNGRTFAEMSTREKNLLSHRGAAIRKFLLWFKGERGQDMGE